MMVVSSIKTFLCTKTSHLHQPKNTKRFTFTTFARIKPDSSNNFPKAKKILAQSAIAVLGLGFVDAGYSGDWSRIGVITNETENVLKIAAFLVVPLCLFLIWSLSNTKLDK